MGHIGLLPQSSNKFKLKGKNQNDRKKILEDAVCLSNSGVFGPCVNNSDFKTLLTFTISFLLIV